MTSHQVEVARRKLAPLPEGWEVFRFQRMGPDATLLTGGVPRILTRGPRKGRKQWSGGHLTVAVTDAEVAAEHARYEATTGHCGDCFSTGRVWDRWSAGEGSSTKPCARCAGTGVAPA